MFESGRSERGLVGCQRVLMIKVDKGLDLVMSLGGGPKMDSKPIQYEWRAPVIPCGGVGLDQRETGSEGTKFGGLETYSSGSNRSPTHREVVAQDTSLSS